MQLIPGDQNSLGSKPLQVSYYYEHRSDLSRAVQSLHRISAQGLVSTPGAAATQGSQRHTAGISTQKETLAIFQELRSASIQGKC